MDISIVWTTKTILTMNMKWKNTDYRLLLAKDFTSDTAGQVIIKGDTLNFASKALKEYGKVKIDFKTLDFSKKPCIINRSGDKVKNAYLITKGSLNFSFILRETMNFKFCMTGNRIISSCWDPWYFQSIPSKSGTYCTSWQKINVKPDWTTEFELK